jgi:predicted RNA binding protein YcfA (HicA-like mRNA interferase family)
MHPHQLQQLLTARGYVLLRQRGSHRCWQYVVTGHKLTVSITSHAMSRTLLAVIERWSLREASRGAPERQQATAQDTPEDAFPPFYGASRIGNIAHCMARPSRARRTHGNLDTRGGGGAPHRVSACSFLLPGGPHKQL